MNPNAQQNTAGGLACGVATFVVWGLTPLYFRALQAVAPAEVLVHRILWSALLLAIVLGVRGGWRNLLRCLQSRRTLALLGLSSLQLAGGSLLYVYAVSSGQVLQSSLGYVLGPLFTVLLGALFLHDRMHGRQWAALGLSVLGLGYLVVVSGEPPWLALGLAVSFAFYSLARKLTPADSVVALSVEMMLLMPASAVFLGATMLSSTAAFGQGNYVLDMMLVFSGVVAAVPFLLFGSAVRGLRLSTLGFLQYLAPGLQLLLAVAVFGEPFQPAQALGFGCVWAALFWFEVEGVLFRRRASAADEHTSVGHGGRSSSPPYLLPNWCSRLGACDAFASHAAPTSSHANAGQERGFCLPSLTTGE
jgi:chloramphenicol-sensitive protein RarD